MVDLTRTIPSIPGLRIEECIGRGGFATVYKAWQNRPGRSVAVKVLEGDNFDGERLRQFEVETTTMARVSNHPSIVSIFAADTAPDGRPYIVMELYGRGHYGQRSKGGRLAQTEVLRVIISVASAVETAHRAGILHRDIKPENILLNDYNRPGLTDFGIASARTGEPGGENAMTVPYAAPELLRGSGGPSQASDVYALAATAWALLAGYSPFEIGRPEPALDLMRRILTAAVPRLPRDDVHPRLEQVLRQAMDADPSARPATARDLALALQRVEMDLGLLPTEIELPSEQPAERTSESVSDGPGSGDPADDDRTRGKAVVMPYPTPVNGSDRTAPPAVSNTEDTDGRTVQRGVLRAKPNSSPADEETAEGRPANRAMLLAAVAVLVVVGAGVVAVQNFSSPSPVPQESQPGLPTAPPDVGDPLRVPEWEITSITRPERTRIEIFWDSPGAEPGDELLVRRVDQGSPWPEPRVFTTPPALVEVEADSAPCFEVWMVSGTRMSEQLTACVPPGSG